MAVHCLDCQYQISHPKSRAESLTFEEKVVLHDIRVETRCEPEHLPLITGTEDVETAFAGEGS